MHITMRMIWEGNKLNQLVYVNFDKPATSARERINYGLILEKRDDGTFVKILNRCSVELTDDLFQQINDVLLIQEI